MNKLAENEGVVPYEPISPLFTDYAFKKRFVYMPKNTQATIPDDPDGTLDFPENTILIKNFYYPSDFRKPEGEKRIVETRILFKKNGKWHASKKPMQKLPLPQQYFLSDRPKSQTAQF
jgi:hypothetical protein